MSQSFLGIIIQTRHMQAANATPNTARRKGASVKKQSSPTLEACAGSEIVQPNEGHREYLARGLNQPGGKLPLFDLDGQRINAQTIQECIEAGWCEPWYANPIKPDWLVCRLTKQGKTCFESSPKRRS